MFDFLFLLYYVQKMSASTTKNTFEFHYSCRDALKFLIKKWKFTKKMWIILRGIANSIFSKGFIIHFSVSCNLNCQNRTRTFGGILRQTVYILLKWNRRKTANKVNVYGGFHGVAWNTLYTHFKIMAVGIHDVLAVTGNEQIFTAVARIQCHGCRGPRKMMHLHSTAANIWLIYQCSSGFSVTPNTFSYRDIYDGLF